MHGSVFAAMKDSLCLKVSSLTWWLWQHPPSFFASRTLQLAKPSFHCFADERPLVWPTWDLTFPPTKLNTTWFTRISVHRHRGSPLYSPFLACLCVPFIITTEECHWFEHYAVENRPTCNSSRIPLIIHPSIWYTYSSSHSSGLESCS